MRRAIVAIVLALAAVPSAAPANHGKCEGPPSGEPYLEAWWLGPEATGNHTNSLVLEGIDGYYFEAGTWKLEIRRPRANPTFNVVINSPASGAPAFGPKGTLKAGDYVKGTVIGNGTLLFGNMGCTQTPAGSPI